MKRSCIARVSSAVALTGACALYALPAHAVDLTVISFGGIGKEAQIAAFYKPWEEAGKEANENRRVIAGEWNGEMARIKAMVDTGSVTWNVVQVERPELVRGCEEGLFERLQPETFLNPDDFVAGSLSECGVSFLVWSIILAYNADRLASAPTGWADFWDVNKFPGKRALRRGAKYTLEIALMADGVAPEQIYALLATRAGQDRAFAKLDEIKPHLQWWDAGTQPPQLLASGDLVMSSAYNGRISALRDETNLKIVWTGGIYDIDAWAIPRGAKDLAAARDFIAFAVGPQAQKRYVDILDYGSTNKEAMTLVAPERLAQLPSGPANFAVQLPIDIAFWIDWGEQLEERFAAWAAR